MSEFLGDLEELSSWASTTRELLEKKESGGYNQEVVDPKVCYVEFVFIRTRLRRIPVLWAKTLPSSMSHVNCVMLTLQTLPTI